MRNGWSDRDGAEFQARYEPGLEGEVAAAAYAAHLLQDEDTAVSQGSVCMKGGWTNILGESLPALFVFESGRTSSPGVLDLTYLRRLASLNGLGDEGLLQEFRTHMLEFRARIPSPETLVHAFLPMKHTAHVHAGAISALTDAPDGLAA